MANPNVQKVPKLLLQLNEWQAQGRLDKARGQTLNGQRHDRAGRQSERMRAETKWTTRKGRGAIAADRPKSIQFDPIRSDPKRRMTASLCRLSLRPPLPSLSTPSDPCVLSMRSDVAV